MNKLILIFTAFLIVILAQISLNEVVSVTKEFEASIQKTFERGM